MNYEFDPTLTPGAQNSYAKGMVGPNTPESASTDAEAEIQTRPQVDAEKVGKVVGKEIGQELGNSIKDLREEMVRQQVEQGRLDLDEAIAQGRITGQMAEDLRRWSQQKRPTMEQQFGNDLDILKNGGGSERERLAAFQRFQGIARELRKKGVNDGDIDALAFANKDIISDEDMSRLVDKVMVGRNLEKQIDRVQNSVAKRVEYGSPEYNEQLMDQYYPPSLEDVGLRAMDLEEEAYQTGGKHEIVNANGELQAWNLRRWMRDKWLNWGHKLNPDDPQSSPFNTVAIQSLYTRLDLLSMLTNNRYWRKREKVPDPKNPANQALDEYGEPMWRYVDSHEYQNLRNELLNEFWLFGKAHTFDATVRPLKGNEGEFFKNVVGLYGQNVFLQARDRILMTWKLDATSGKKEDLQREYDSWMKVEGSGGALEEGRVGRALRLADLLYFRMAHLEKWDDNKGRDNKFYEALGEKGVKEFYRSMVKRGLEGMYTSKGGVTMEIIKKADLEGVDLAEIMFRSNANEMRALFTKGENALKQEKLNALLKEKNLTLDQFIGKSIALRETLLQSLTGWESSGRKLDISGKVGFRDWERVRSLFEDASGSLGSMEELGLRFIDLKLGGGKQSQGTKWEKDNTRSEAWKNGRKELNLFNATSKDDPFQKAVRYAIQDAAGSLNSLDSLDAEYAENLAFVKVYFTFTSGYNDTTATGFDAATKLLRLMDYRKNNFGGAKNFVGNQQNLLGIKRVLLTLWEGAYGMVDNPDGSKKKASLLSVMENGFTEKTRGAKVQTVDFDKGIEATFGANHIAMGFKLYERILKGPLFNFEEYVKTDNYNNVQTSPKAIADVLNEVNKSIRYTYNQLGLNFEDIEDEIEIVWEKDKNGELKPKPVFVTKKLKDVLFNEEIVNMGMYEQRFFQSKWINGKIGMKDIKGEDMLTEYSRNIMAYFAAKEILEHRLYNPKDSSYNYNIWELDMIRAIEGFFANIPMGEFEERAIGWFNKNKKMRKTGSFFNRKEFKKIRLMGNAGYGKLWFEELRAQAAESAWKGNTGTANKFFAYIFQDMWSFK